MESSHLVIFSTPGKFITKFNVLRCISLIETPFWTGDRGGIPITLKCPIFFIALSRWRQIYEIAKLSPETLRISIIVMAIFIILSPLVTLRFYIQSRPSKFNYCFFTFKRNNQRTKKPVNRFLQDGGSAGIQSLQTSIVVKLCQTPSNGL